MDPLLSDLSFCVPSDDKPVVVLESLEEFYKSANLTLVGVKVIIPKYTLQNYEFIFKYT
jgi:hypothetical protein